MGYHDASSMNKVDERSTLTKLDASTLIYVDRSLTLDQAWYQLTGTFVAFYCYILIVVVLGSQ